MAGTFSGFGQKAIPFLKALDFHQNREWFQENRDLFESELREPLGNLVETLSERFGAVGLGLRGDRKKSLFRINRDVRFSKDKRPYTTHVSAILSPDGTKMEQGVFFFHLGLDACFAAVAWWQPETAMLQAMRRAIETRPEQFRKLVAVLKKGKLELGTQGAMKRMPRGFEHVADADLAAAIRNRHFVVRQDVEPTSIHTLELADILVDFAIRARPLLDWGRAIQGTVVPAPQG